MGIPHINSQEHALRTKQFLYKPSQLQLHQILSGKLPKQTPPRHPKHSFRSGGTMMMGYALTTISPLHQNHIRTYICYSACWGVAH